MSWLRLASDIIIWYGLVKGILSHMVSLSQLCRLGMTHLPRPKFQEHQPVNTQFRESHIPEGGLIKTPVVGEVFHEPATAAFL